MALQVTIYIYKWSYLVHPRSRALKSRLSMEVFIWPTVRPSLVSSAEPTELRLYGTYSLNDTRFKNTYSKNDKTTPFSDTKRVN